MITPVQAELVPSVPKQALVDAIDATLASEYLPGTKVVVSIGGSKKIVDSILIDYQAVGWVIVNVGGTDYEFSV